MVAANRTCQASRHTNNHQRGVIREHCGNNGNQNTKGSPRSTGCKCQYAGYQEDDCRQEQAQSCSGTVHQVCHKILSAHQRCDVLECSCKGENQDCRNHCIKAGRNTFHHFFERNGVTARIVNHCNYQGNQTTPRQCNGCIGFGKCSYKIHTVQKTTVINQCKYANDNQHGNRENQIDDLTLFGGGYGSRFCSVTACVEVTVVDSIELVCSHRTVIEAKNRKTDDKYKGQERIEIERNSRNKEFKSLSILGILRNSRCPAGNRSNHTNGSRGCINDVSKLCSGDFMRIGYGTHNRTDCETVEIVIYKNQNAKNKGGKNSTYTGFDVGLCPLTKRGRAACLINEGYKNAKLNKEDKNTCCVANRRNQRFAQCRIDGCNGIEICVKQCARNNTHEKRAIHFFCNQGESDCNYGRNECPKATAYLSGTATGFAFCTIYQTGCLAINASNLVHRTAGNTCDNQHSNNDESRHCQCDFLCF